MEALLGACGHTVSTVDTPLETFAAVLHWSPLGYGLQKWIVDFSSALLVYTLTELTRSIFVHLEVWIHLSAVNSLDFDGVL